MKRYAIALPLLLVLVACDNGLKNVSNGLNDAAQAIDVLQTTVIAANTNGLVNDNDTATILRLCIKVNQAGKDATAITRAISKLDKPNASQLMGILNPVIAAVQNAIDNGLAGVKDPATLTKIKGILLTVQSGLNAVQLTLAGV